MFLGNEKSSGEIIFTMLPFLAASLTAAFLPLHLQSVNDESASLRRVLKYVVPVILFSVVFNIPKVHENLLLVSSQYTPIIAILTMQ